MIRVPDDLAASIRFYGSARAALKKAEEINCGAAADALRSLVLTSPLDLIRVQSGCRLVDSDGVEYMMTDMFHVVRMTDGVSVNHKVGLAWPVEVRSCPKE